jgi:hypothetical protein
MNNSKHKARKETGLGLFPIRSCGYAPMDGIFDKKLIIVLEKGRHTLGTEISVKIIISSPI